MEIKGKEGEKQRDRAGDRIRERNQRIESGDREMESDFFYTCMDLGPAEK